jgi:hypothetical protein
MAQRPRPIPPPEEDDGHCYDLPPEQWCSDCVNRDALRFVARQRMVAPRKAKNVNFNPLWPYGRRP